MEFQLTQKTVFIPEEQVMDASELSLLKAKFHKRKKKIS